MSVTASMRSASGISARQDPSLHRLSPSSIDEGEHVLYAKSLCSASASCKSLFSRWIIGLGRYTGSGGAMFAAAGI